MKHISRRDFVVSAVLLGVAAPLLIALRADESDERDVDPRWLGLPIVCGVRDSTLEDVRLRDSTRFDARCSTPDMLFIDVSELGDSTRKY